MKLSVWFVLVALVVIDGLSTLRDIIQSRVSNLSENLITPLIDISIEYFAKDRHVLVIFSKNYISMFNSFMKEISSTNIPLIILEFEIFQELLTKHTKVNDHLVKFILTSDVYIFFLIRPGNILNVVLDDNMAQNVNTKSRFLFIASEEDKVEEMKNILHIAWTRNKIIHAIVVMNLNKTYSSTTRSSLSILTYNPFIHAQNVHSLPATNGKLKINLYPDKMLNLYGYPLTTTYASHFPFLELSYNEKGVPQYSGFVGKTFETLSWCMNFTVRSKERYDGLNYGSKLSNGTWTGIIGDIAYKRVDMSLNALFLSYSRAQAFDFTDTLDMNMLCFLVPKADFVPSWKRIFLVYENMTWLSIAITFIYVQMSFLFTLRYTTKHDTPSGILESLLYVFSTAVSVSVPRQPKGNTFRILFIIYAYFCLVINSLFTGSIVEMSTSSHYYKDINSIEQLVESQLKVTAVPNSIEYIITSSENVQLMKLRNKLIYYHDDIRSIIHSIAKGNTLAIFGVEAHLKAILSTESAEISSKLHFSKEAVGRFNLVVPVNKHSPYLQRINSLYGRIKQAGLYAKWYRDIVPDEKTQQLSGSNVALTLEQMQSTFYILVFGLSTALACFIVELSRHTVDSKEMF